jgi:cytochrome c biogenesis protein
VTLLDAPERLSTAPEPVAADPIGPRGRRKVSLRKSWRRLTSMRTALVLLFLLALAAVPGSLLPQRANEAVRVQDFLLRHRTLGPLMDRLSLFDVFAAPWFAAVYLLLMISLVGCLVPRWRLHLRALLRRPPRTPARLTRLPQHVTFTTAVPAAEVASRARGVLRRKGWRTVRDEPEAGSGAAAATVEIAAEKGYLRETGNLAFHVAIVALLVGVGYGSVYGYQGDRVLIESRALPSGSTAAATLTDTVGQYDDYRPGRLVAADSLVPWTMRLNAFDATYQPGTNTAKDYQAKVSYRRTLDAPWQQDTIRVNHPLVLGGTKVYLLNHGYAPVFRLRGPGIGDQVQPVVCPATSSVTLLSSCTVVFADLPGPAVPGGTLGFQVRFAPTGVVDPVLGTTSVNPRLVNPDAFVTAYAGDLGLDRAHSVYSFDTTRATRAGVHNLVLNDARPEFSTMSGLPGGYTLDITAVGQWASFQVKRDPGKGLVLLAAIAMIAGILASLRVRRRRLWVRARPAATSGEAAATLVEVGGLTRTDGDGFAEEFSGLVERLRGVTADTSAKE